ncbi:MAG: TRAP transporter substrate-binding protein DctP [Gammaproteobacteria bacterium]|nr:TRAP transporter substrate-binding protein DctP [Gammaproteobacteria bacterium]
MKKIACCLIVFCSFFVFSNAVFSATFKIATLSPDGSYWMTKLRAAADEVKQKTLGRVKFKFYPGGVMGDDKAVLKKMRIRQLQGGAFTSNALSKYYKDLQIYNLLNIFHSLHEVDYVRSKMDGEILKGLQKGGIEAIGLAEMGFAYVMSMQPVVTVDDIRKSKAWVPDNDPTALAAIKSFGISPIPLAFSDVLLGLQSGMIETVAGTPIAAIALQWHTQIKYLANIPLPYIFGIFALDQKAFNKLSVADQQIVRDVFSKALKEIDKQNRKDNVAALAALKNNNIQFLEPDKAGLQEFITLSSMANAAQLDKGNVSRPAYAELTKYLQEYREHSLVSK